LESPQVYKHGYQVDVVPSRPESEEISMSAEKNKALVRRFYEELDKGNIEALDQLRGKLS
jgi:hypothetical protein